MAEGSEFLRVRGIGRERFASYLADFLTENGYTVERSEVADPAESRVSAELTRLNPAVPDGGRSLAFRFYPTSGGAAMSWTQPTSMPESDRARMDRLVRELVAHLERVISTESHATAKVTRSSAAVLPWQNGVRPGPAEAVST
jgi:hypothetical protein